MKDTCKWRSVSDGIYLVFKTDCGHTVEKANTKMKTCPYCSKKLEIIR